MRKATQDLLKEEEKILSPYAVFSKNPGNREFPEEEHPYRLPFQRDKDRIVHSHAFKRLEYKTQVFIYSEGDHFRNRLTHTLEVAGISRTISKVLGLNEDLSECIALAHDLGHSPFGHAGQEALADLMRGRGGFEHNKQSLRVVRILERKYPNFPGLNLCGETLLGIMKHGGDYDHSELHGIRKEEGPSLEAMIVDFSDEITYSAHDLEDGLESGFLKLDEIQNLKIWKRLKDQYHKSGNLENQESIIRLLSRIFLNTVVSEFIDETDKRISTNRIRSRSDVSLAYKNQLRLVGFSEEFSEEFREVKSFLFEALYRHPQVVRMSEHGKETIHLLFKHFESHPEKIPESYLIREEKEGRARVVCDYIAGMTDRYAIEKLKSEGIFWFPYV